MINFEALRFSRNMKYTALYSSMFFAEDDENIYKKIYEDGTVILIEADTQKLFINNKFSFLLNSHESFVKLECIDRILNLGYTINDIEHISNEDFFFFKGFKIIFFTWNNQYDFEKLTDNVILYKSRLVSGVIEYKSKIRTDDVYDYGVFEKKVNHFIFRKDVDFHGVQAVLLHPLRQHHLQGRGQGRARHVLRPEDGGAGSQHH